MPAMPRLVAFLYRLCVGALLGAQLFFAAVAAQVIFSPEVAALPRDDARRRVAADLVGALLARLDRMTLTLAAVAALSAILLARLGGLPRARLAALPPLVAGVLALLSSAYVTPAIHAARLSGDTGSAHFGRLHAFSSMLLLVEMVMLAVAVWIAPESPQQRGA
jgi:hypothetical protein